MNIHQYKSKIINRNYQIHYNKNPYRISNQKNRLANSKIHHNRNHNRWHKLPERWIRINMIRKLIHIMICLLNSRGTETKSLPHFHTMRIKKSPSSLSKSTVWKRLWANQIAVIRKTNCRQISRTRHSFKKTKSHTMTQLLQFDNQHYHRLVKRDLWIHLIYINSLIPIMYMQINHKLIFFLRFNMRGMKARQTKPSTIHLIIQILKCKPHNIINIRMVIRTN